MPRRRSIYNQERERKTHPSDNINARRDVKELTMEETDAEVRGDDEVFRQP